MSKITSILIAHSIREADNDNSVDHKPLTNFKEFDYKGYDVKNMKRADSMLKRAWDSIKKAMSSTELKYAAGLLLAAAIILSNNDKMISVLKDIVNGRVDFDTLQDFKDALVDIAKKLSLKKDTHSNLRPLPDTGITLRQRR